MFLLVCIYYFVILFLYLLCTQNSDKDYLPFNNIVLKLFVYTQPDVFSFLDFKLVKLKIGYQIKLSQFGKICENWESCNILKFHLIWILVLSSCNICHTYLMPWWHTCTVLYTCLTWIIVLSYVYLLLVVTIALSFMRYFKTHHF